MSVRGYAGRLLQAVLVVVAVSLVVGSVVGQPILFGFVESGSMAPALESGDGFVAIPAFLAGDVREGDVVVFEAERLHDGGLTTHRIVGETPGGYVTKGDANPFTDQDGPEPPVTDEQVVAHVFTIGDAPLAIPFLGALVLGVRSLVGAAQQGLASALGLGPPYGTQGAGLFLVTLGVALFVLTAVYDRVGGPTRERRRSRSRSGVLDTRKLAVVLLVVVLLPANAAMVLPAGTFDLTVDGDVVSRSSELQPGDPATWDYTITNFGVVPLAFAFESESPAVTVPGPPTLLGPNDDTTVQVGMAAPPPGERAVAQIREYRYLLVVPPAVLGALHEIDPLVALAGVNAVLLAGVLLVSGRLFGFGRMRLRWGAGVPLSVRLRRWFG